uniref:type VI secretion system Vgr family protein n=1 Tax=Falsiroseomonas oryzae TaxID=2766473 RepID=UPI0022EAFFD9
MALKNKGRELEVFTALDTARDGRRNDPDRDDPLVLVHVSGAEGISMPYAFDLTMVGTPEVEVEARRIVGHAAHFRIRRNAEVNGKPQEGHVTRYGVIETLERLGSLNGRRTYRARLVPTFRLAAFDQRNRVFENRTLVDILHEVLDPFQHMLFDKRLLSDEVKQHVIPFCAQYNETTFAFVHRLLDRHGISYRFRHDDDIQREEMVLSDGEHRPPSIGFMHVTKGGTGPFDITAFKRSFVSTGQHVKLGDFNELDPKNTPVDFAAVHDAYAMAAQNIGLRAEIFPSAAFDAIPARAGKELPTPPAARRMHQAEASVVSASGRTRQVDLTAGRHFSVSRDDTKAGFNGQSYVVKLAAIEAFHFADDRSFGDKFVSVVRGTLGSALTLVLGEKAGKAAAGATGLKDDERENDLLGEAAERVRDKVKADSLPKAIEIHDWLKNKPGASDPSGLPDSVGKAIGRGGSALVAALTAAGSLAKTVVDAVSEGFEKSHGYACAFEAIPVDGDFQPDRWPTPGASRPLAAGPHLALVVGPKGIATTEHDIFTDALGRVRIRFAWDPGPNGPEPDKPADDRLASDRNTCWVRVAEGWAGERYGVQFLPRIGEEVLVGFLDGDPERPIIVGRAYNAGSGSTHLPFPALSVAGRNLEHREDLAATVNDRTTRSGIRTRSTPAKGARDAGFHMIRFEDEQGKEQFLLRAEHRLDTTSTGSRYDTTRGSHHIRVGGGPPPKGADSGGGAFTSIGGEQNLEVAQKRYDKVTSDEHRTVGGSALAGVTGVSFTSSDKQLVLTADFLMLHARSQIQLVVGNSHVLITPVGVQTVGAIVPDKEQNSPEDPPAPVLEEPLGAAQADPGEPPDWLAQQARAGGKGGGRRHRQLKVKQAMYVTDIGDGQLRVSSSKDSDKGFVIQADGDANYATRVVGELQDMRDDPDTCDILAAAENRQHPVVFTKPPEDGSVNVPQGDPENGPDAVREGDYWQDNTLGGLEPGTGQGTGTIVQHDPAMAPTRDPDDPEYDARLRRNELAEVLRKSQSHDSGDTPGRDPAGEWREPPEGEDEPPSGEEPPPFVAPPPADGLPPPPPPPLFQGGDEPPPFRPPPPADGLDPPPPPDDQRQS